MAGGAPDRTGLIVVCATAAELAKTASANRNVSRRASIAKSPLIEAEQGALLGSLQKVNTADNRVSRSAIYAQRDFPDLGGLIGYGPGIRAVYRHARNGEIALSVSGQRALFPGYTDGTAHSRRGRRR